MVGVSKSRSLADMNMDVHRPKRLGGWRQLYLQLLHKIEYHSIAEIGAGSPDFLKAINGNVRRIAIDGGSRYQDEFITAGVEFHVADLDRDPFPDIGPVDVAVCSDVFEHLIWPERTLGAISNILGEHGILISHVPNEFVFWKTIKIMLGCDEAMYSHPHCEEWFNPHLRRFTNKGYLKFLKLHFQHNVYISHLRKSRLIALLDPAGTKLPYAFQFGPAYISTNDPDVANRIKSLVAREISF
jgi:SAM-dependent methyltransferase